VQTHLAWLVGTNLSSVEKKDFSWFFIFSNGGSVVTESPWRLVTTKGIVVTSEDHGHLFGRKEPTDAAASVLTATRNKKVQAFQLSVRSSDLIVAFNGNIQIEFLNMSGGYEAWRALFQSLQVICTGGGELAVFKE
jgi:hypothetical protein